MTNKPKISNTPYSDVVKIKTELNYGGLKTFVVALIIVIQFAIQLFSLLYLYSLFKWLNTISYIISFVFCLITLSSKRTGQTKAIWILFMLVCPTFGWIIFLLSNEKIMFGRNKKKYQKIFEKSDFEYVEKDIKNLPKAIQNDCNYLTKYGKFKIYSNSQSKYFPNGACLYDEIIEDLKNAKKFIFIEYYIIADGVLLNRILSILETKAKEGVDIRIIYDDMGSHGTLKRKTKKRIRKSGIKLQDFNKLVPVFNLALNLRDHRKIVVIDGNIAFTGGANLADEYINEKRIHGYWKDSGIKLTGKSANTFTLAFLRQWEFLTNTKQDYSSFVDYKNSEEKDIKSVTIPYVTGPDSKHKIARDVYENMIASANEKIFITTPYFIPDETIINLLKNKSQSGVDVRIVLPKIPDKKFVYLISLDGAESLIEAGAKIYVMENAFVHSKLLMTENACVIGSINMDQRSFYQQFESAVYTNEKDIMQSLNDDFNLIISRSQLHEKKKYNFLKNTIIHILRLISPLM